MFVVSSIAPKHLRVTLQRWEDLPVLDIDLLNYNRRALWKYGILHKTWMGEPGSKAKPRICRYSIDDEGFTLTTYWPIIKIVGIFNESGF